VTVASVRVVGVTRRFGGLTALDDVSLELSPGTVHGLIGPNGSGKTTLLNILSGYYRVDGGSIHVGGTDMSTLPVDARPKLGIGRTFQKPRLLNDLSALDNIMVGGWTERRAGFVAGLVGSPRTSAEELALRDRAVDLIHGLGLGTVRGRPASLLDHAEQRLVEIGRALMARPRFILLDEPASGLTGHEIDRLGTIVRQVRDCGVGVLLVEHHTDLVFRISDVVTVLDLGRVVAAGSPEGVQADPDVKRVYLGT
jgi:ABC-type branched-subunit amino acid transport system ATPase component